MLKKDDPEQQAVYYQVRRHRFLLSGLAGIPLLSLDRIRDYHITLAH